ncbi:MAG TPA: polysaccharide deacetylase family protein [bacterium]|nr:polysaccharide deacetylase family protein [bacterium]HNS48861.1 polysaccharide deacetylase family protein [bacterium]
MEKLILAYHRVNDWSDDTLVVPPGEFRRQLTFLKARYRVVPLLELAEARPEPGGQRLAAISFDDGYRDNFRWAASILAELKLTATFFLTAGLIGTDRLLPRDRAGADFEGNGLMTWTEVIRLQAQGFSFGSHGLSHLKLTGADPETARREIAESKQIIETRLEREVNLFCYPYGAWNEEVARLVAGAGYRYAFVTPGGRQAGENDYTLKRVGVYRHTAFWQFRLKTHPLYRKLRGR